MNNIHCYSRGNINAPIVIVGEAPGEEERSHLVEGTDIDTKVYKVLMPIPFCGPAGRLLHRLLYWVGLSEGDFIFMNATNEARFYPDGRVKTPGQTEIEINRDNLILSIVKVNPKLIITVGKIALWTLCYKNKCSMSGLRMTENNGVEHQFNAIQKGYPFVEIPVLPIIHPSAVLRDKDENRGYRKALRRVLEENKELILNAKRGSNCNKQPVPGSNEAGDSNKSVQS